MSIVELSSWFWILATVSLWAAVLVDKFHIRIDSLLEYGARASMFKRQSLFQVPKRLFCHFYFVGVFQDAWIASIYLTKNDWRKENLGAAVALVLHFLHVARRLYECFFTSVLSNSAKMHLGHYLIGISYYVFVPLTIVNQSRVDFQNTSLLAIAVVCFFGWMWVQHDSLKILGNLRRNQKTKDMHKYSMPRGGWFEWISCPHFLAEIGIYVALVMMNPSNASLWMCLMWVISNQTISAVRTHEFYKKTYRPYPKSRKAIFPFLL